MARRSSTPTVQHNSEKGFSSRNTTTDFPPPPQRAKIHLPLRLDHIFHHHDDEKTQSPDDYSRPALPARQNSVQTRYMNMLLGLDTIPRLHNILAAFFTWILLAGFIIFPGTFTSLNTLSKNARIADNETAVTIIASVKHIPLLYVGAFCSGLGGLGMISLWMRWRQNYVWLLNRIFLPGCLNSLMGLISTFINVYSQQGGHWSVTAWVTATVTGSVMCITGGLFGIYNFWALDKVRKLHGLEMDGGHDGERLVEKIERHSRKPGMEPGSVV